MIWDLVKDLEVEITPTTALKIIPKLEAKDWSAIRKELLESINDNQKAQKQLKILDKILEALESGLYVLSLVK